MGLSLTNFLTSRPFNQIALVVIDVFAAWLIFKVYKSNPSKRVNRLFALMTVSFLFWVNGGYFFAFPYDLNVSLILGRIILAVVIWSFILLYFLLTFFPREDEASRSLDFFEKAIILFGVVFSLITAFTGFIVEGVRLTELGVDPIYNTYGRFVYYGVISFLMIISVYQMLRKYPKLSRGEKSKVIFFFLGITIFVSMNFLFNVFLPLWRGSIAYWQFGNYAAVFLLGLTAYAVVERQLLDMKVIATEALTLVIWVILFSKLLVTQSSTELIVDALVLGIIIVFGILLIQSVNREVSQKEKLQELNRRLKELDKQKDEFVSMAAHELRAPMTAIKGYLSMVMQGDAGEITEKARGYLADADAINERLVRLVNNMLNVSRIEEGRMVYQLEIENLSHHLRSVYSRFAPEAERKGLEYKLKIPSEIRDKVQVDGDRIQEVIANLLSNAVKYTDSGSVTAQMSQPKPDRVRVEVVDTGPGISDHEQKKLFQKFYRVETNVGKTTGTGLGLYISKLLVNKFNGEIGLSSKLGEGSTFWFELPLVSS